MKKCRESGHYYFYEGEDALSFGIKFEYIFIIGTTDCFHSDWDKLTYSCLYFTCYTSTPEKPMRMGLTRGCVEHSNKIQKSKLVTKSDFLNDFNKCCRHDKNISKMTVVDFLSRIEKYEKIQKGEKK